MNFDQFSSGKTEILAHPEPTSQSSLPNSKLSRRAVLGAGVAGGTLLTADKIGLGVGLFIPVSEEHMQIPENAGVYEKKLGVLYNNMMDDFKAGNDLLFATSEGLFRNYASVWPFGRAVDALYTMGLVTGIEEESATQYFRRREAFKEYWSTKPKGYEPGYDPGISEFRFLAQPERLTDDNLWIGLILMREYKQTQDPILLRRAHEIFRLVTSQWDPVNGGILWKEQFEGESNKDRGIVSNAPAVILGVELYKAASDPSYKDWYRAWSEDIFTWTQTLKDEKRNTQDHIIQSQDDHDGLYFDHHYYDEEKKTFGIDKKKWTYTQGAMVGAMVKMHELNPERYKVQEAVDLANASLTYFDKKDHEAREHNPMGEGYEGTEFSAIFFANLLALADKYGDSDFKRNVQHSLSVRVGRLKEKYSNLLHHAGAVHLAALVCVPEDRYKYLI